MRGVVLLLTTKVPGHEGDALEGRVGLTHLPIICPVTHNNPHSAQVNIRWDITHPVCVCVCVWGCVYVCVCVCGDEHTVMIELQNATFSMEIERSILLLWPSKKSTQTNI